MKEIKLSKHGKYKDIYIALVDDEDYEYLNSFNWFVAKQKTDICYAKRNIRINGKQVPLFMHSAIIKSAKGFDIDHIDHNGLNNQKYNLRECTRSQNNMNSRPKGRTKYKGVCYDKKSIQSILSYKGVRYYLGNYKTEEEAAIAYDKKAKELYGEFANLNFK